MHKWFLVPLAGVLCMLPLAATKSISLGGELVVSRYEGLLFSRPGYDYAVTAFRDTDGYLKIYWCGGNAGTGVWDHIYYAKSLTGTSWTMPVDVMAPAPLALAGDPSIIRVDGRYYMYFTGTGDPAGIRNDIYLAVSDNGIDWTKYPGGADPLPIIRRQNGEPVYGVGQPSALYLDGQFVLYYLDQTNPGGNGLYRAVSRDGIEFSGHTFIAPVNDTDVKYCPERGLFLMTRNGQFDSNYRTHLHVSYDGFHFTPADNQKYLDVPGTGESRTVSAGILGDIHGQMEASTSVYYGLGDPAEHGEWELHKSILAIGDLNDLAVYRYYSGVNRRRDHFYSMNANSPPEYDFETLAWISLSPEDSRGVPVYRLYHPGKQDHFYTTDAAERDRAVQDFGYQPEGTEGWVGKQRHPELVPIYRLYRPKTGNHFYTVIPAENQAALFNGGYISEGLLGYAYAFQSFLEQGAFPAIF